MDDAVLPLEKEYCPPIDPALFSAILSDYDLSDPPRIDEVRSVLNALKESADAEGTADFDPSGSNGLLYATGNHESPDRARSWHGEEAARSEETDSTGLSQHIEMLGIEPFPEPETEERERKHGEDYDKGLDQLSPWEKEDLLKEMFPTMKAFDISYSLKKNKYNFGRTVEELLNHVFFEEEQEANGDGHVVAKGIDAFMDGADGTRGRKAKAKRRKQTNLRRTSSNPAPLAHNPTSSSSSSPQKLSSKWELAKQDVEFITQRTYLSPQTVSSQYHQSGASLAATISALCASSNLPPNPPITSPTSPILDLHASLLAASFPTIPPSHIHALIHLTHPSTASAHDLARAITTPPNPHSRLQLLPLYQRPSLSSSQQSPTTSSQQSPTTSSHQSPTPPSPTTSPLPPAITHHHALHLATTHTATRTALLALASTTHRQSRSHPLLSSATLHHTQTARTHALAAARYRALAADALAAQQSGDAHLDLHGLGVRDAVRIAGERIRGWWERSGRAEWRGTGRADGEGFRIVTGVGRHSEGGRGRLGPAVGGMLVREGWRVEVGTGWLVVSGRARR